MSAALISGLAPGLTAVRLSLHVLAAAIWVGGQFVVAGMLPTLRRLGADAPRTVARAFGRLEWPAYAVLIATGVWNLAAVKPSTQGTAWQAVLWVKVAVALCAGLFAFVHTRARSRAVMGACGGAAGIFSLAALVLGVLLTG